MTHNDLRYEFGPYQLNPSKRILTRNGEGIPLTPKATEILLVLVKHAEQLIEKDELLKEVWPDTFVGEANLSQNIFTLRRALGDDRTGPKYIETIARRGYRFMSSVKTIGANEHKSEDFAEAADQRPVVVVLPFHNNTGDVELDYLVDGLTHNVINNLSRLSQLCLMSHSAAFRYKTRERDPQRVGKELRATSPHQWYFVYRVSKQLYEESFSEAPTLIDRDSCLVTQIPSIQLTPTEEVQILCSVTRDQITIGNFEAARLILKRWALPRKWPSLASLNPHAAANLLFTLGTLFGSVAGTTQVVHGHKQAEAFLNGSIALFAQLGLASRSSEARIELARCYYKQGLFDLGCETLSEAFSELPGDQRTTWGSCC